jgi:hypothetical protein
MAGAEIAATWRCIVLPRRRWWWPPCRTTLTPLHAIRLRLMRREVSRALGGECPDVILTQLYLRFPLLAAHCSAAWNVPLGVFVFDEREVWEENLRERARLALESSVVLQAARRVWAVSEEMRDAYINQAGSGGAAKFSVLRPIPQGGVEKGATWNERFARRPVIAYAGSLHDFHLPSLRTVAGALASLNGELLVICDETNAALRALRRECSNVRQQDFLPQDELVPFLAREASAALVAYAFDPEAQPWSRCSFPSKFLEFVHSGLPVLLLVPRDTAIHNWAMANGWDGLIDGMDVEAVSVYVKRLTAVDGWCALANQSGAIAGGEFDPARIQKQFEREVELDSYD